ncbi:hypothetical protein FNH08_34250, partial [Streptomyces spongiae]|nr:hypothetical protein [Streptomyces spongiae]
VTGWSAGDGVRAELSPVLGLSDDLTGLTGYGDTLFVALARLTAEPDPVPLADTVTVRADGTGELTVRWREGTEVRVRLGDFQVDVGAGEPRRAG